MTSPTELETMLRDSLGLLVRRYQPDLPTSVPNSYIALLNMQLPDMTMLIDEILDLNVPALSTTRESEMSFFKPVLYVLKVTGAVNNGDTLIAAYDLHRPRMYMSHLAQTTESSALILVLALLADLAPTGYNLAQRLTDAYVVEEVLVRLHEALAVTLAYLRALPLPARVGVEA